MSTVIGFVGGPSAGKSTAAAEYYSLIKKHGRTVELVREQVLEQIYRGDKIPQHDQMLLTARQISSEASLLGKVEYVVTDATPLQYTLYGRFFGGEIYGEAVYHMVMAYIKSSRLEGHRQVYVNVERKYPFDPVGRNISEEHARGMDSDVVRLVKNHCSIYGAVFLNGLEDLDVYVEKEIRCRGLW